MKRESCVLSKPGQWVEFHHLANMHLQPSRDLEWMMMVTTTSVLSKNNMKYKPSHAHTCPHISTLNGNSTPGLHNRPSNSKNPTFIQIHNEFM